MHNVTEISADGLLQANQYIIVWSQTSSALNIFRSSSLELVQSVHIPQPALSVCLIQKRILCLLVDQSLVELDFDQDLGRIDSHATVVFEGEPHQYIDCHEEIVLRVTGNNVCFANRVMNDSTIASGRLLDKESAVMWTSIGSIYVLNESKTEIAKDTFVSTAVNDFGTLHLISSDKDLIEIAMINGHASVSRRTIPTMQPKFSSSKILDSKAYLGTLNGELCVTNTVDLFLKHASTTMVCKSLYGITAIAIFDEDLIVLGTNTGRLHFWSLSRSHFVFESRNHTSSIIDILIIPRGCPEILGLADDGSVSVFRAFPLPELRAVILRRTGVCLKSVRWASDHDDFLWLEYDDGYNHIWNVKSKTCDTTFKEDSPLKDDYLNLFKHSYSLQSPATFATSLTVDIREVLSKDFSWLRPLITKLVLSKRSVSFGFTGAGGNLSFLSPDIDIWKQSPVTTATLGLVLLSTTNDAHHKEDYLGSLCPSHLMLPSLSTLSKFWLDQSVDIQKSARMLFDYTVWKLPDSYIRGFAEYWLSYLPNYSKTSLKSMNRAAIVLGILSLREDKPWLNEEAIKAIADSLVFQALAERSTVFRASAIEIFGSGFHIWKSHVESLSVFRSLFAWLVSVSPDFHIKVEVDVLLYCSITATEKTLLQILAQDKYAVLPYWLGELSSSKIIKERICGLALIGELLKTAPETFEDYLILVIDHVVRMLDPAFPSMRAVITSNVTQILLSFTETFSTVRLHKDSQRLLVGGPKDGTVVVFDLRTATRSHAFEGLTRGVTAVGFSPSAKNICAYSFDEATIRIWTVPSGLLSILGTVYKPIKTVVVLPEITESVLYSKDESENVFSLVNLNWASEKSVNVNIGSRETFRMDLL